MALIKKPLWTLGVFVLVGLIFLVGRLGARLPVSEPRTVPQLSMGPTIAPSTKVFFYPITGFAAEITKKPFGVFISPNNSPVQPERFTGFHTGADVEISTERRKAPVPIFAVADGLVVYSGWVSGYGGVLGLKHSSDEKGFFSLYGHLRPEGLPAIGVGVTAGQQLAILGRDKSQETDGEREHLHFGIITGPDFDLRGYVQSKPELVNWTDPVVFLTDRSARPPGGGNQR